jgi:hypothetical protein
MIFTAHYVLYSFTFDVIYLPPAMLNLFSAWLVKQRSQNFLNLTTTRLVRMIKCN